MTHEQNVEGKMWKYVQEREISEKQRRQPCGGHKAQMPH